MLSKEIKFLLTHSSIYGLGTVISQVVSFLLLPLYTRYLTPADYGALETISVSSGIIGIVVTIGIARALSRFYYESDDESARNMVVSTTYLTCFVLSMLALPLLLYLSAPSSMVLLGTREFASFFEIGYLTLLTGTFVDIGMMYLRLIKKPVVFVSITVARLASLIGLNVFFIVHLGLGILGILYSSFIVSSICAAVLTGAILWKTRISFSPSICKQLIRYGLPMMPSQLGNTIVKQADKYFVLYLISVADMGIYSLALKIGNSIHNLLTVPFNLAYIPRRFEVMKREDAKELYGQIFTYYVFTTGYVGLCLSVLIPEILQVLVTPQFARAGDIVPLVVVSMIIFGMHFHFDFGILYAKKTEYLSYIGIVSAAIQIGLNYLLIRDYGFIGAVWSSIISLGTEACMLYLVSQRFYRVRYEFGRIARFVLAALVFYALSSLIISPLPLALASAAIKCTLLLTFPVCLVWLKIISPNEWGRLKEIYTAKVKPLIFNKVSVKLS